MPLDQAVATFKNSIDHIFNNNNVSGDNVSDIEQHTETDNLKINKDTSNVSKNSKINVPLRTMI